MADMRFDEHTLRAAIVEKWGPAGAHADVFDHILAEIGRLTGELDKFDRVADKNLVQFAQVMRERDEARAWGVLWRDRAAEYRAMAERTDLVGHTRIAADVISRNPAPWETRETP